MPQASGNGSWTLILKYIFLSYGLAILIDIVYYLMGYTFINPKIETLTPFTTTWGFLRMYTPITAAIILIHMNGKYSIVDWLKSKVTIDMKQLIYYVLTPVIALAAVAIHLQLYTLLTGSKIIEIPSPEPLGELPNQYKLLILIVNGYIASITLNAVYAFGEEVGWRAFLLDKIREKYGALGAIILTGIIWGAWHYPAMIILGYGNINIYNQNYIYILYKMLSYLLFTLLVGAVLAYSYWLTNNVLIASGIHGAVNAYWGITFLTTINNEIIRLMADIISWTIVTLPLLTLYIYREAR